MSKINYHFKRNEAIQPHDASGLLALEVKVSTFHFFNAANTLGQLLKDSLDGV